MAISGIRPKRVMPSRGGSRRLVLAYGFVPLAMVVTLLLAPVRLIGQPATVPADLLNQFKRELKSAEGELAAATKAWNDHSSKVTSKMAPLTGNARGAWSTLLDKENKNKQAIDGTLEAQSKQASDNRIDPAGWNDAWAHLRSNAVHTEAWALGDRDGKAAGIGPDATLYRQEQLDLINCSSKVVIALQNVALASLTAPGRPTTNPATKTVSPTTQVSPAAPPGPTAKSNPADKSSSHTLVYESIFGLGVCICILLIVIKTKRPASGNGKAGIEKARKLKQAAEIDKAKDRERAAKEQDEIKKAEDAARLDAERLDRDDRGQPPPPDDKDFEIL